MLSVMKPNDFKRLPVIKMAVFAFLVLQVSAGRLRTPKKHIQSLASLLGKGEQPLRCAASPCASFGSECKKDENCVTDKCWGEKCAAGPTCKEFGTVCYTYAAHDCCTGKCIPVTIPHDCFRLLGISKDIEKNSVFKANVDRQCDVLGVCAAWPGQDLGPGPLTTPWAVRPDDLASKYYNFVGVTFAPKVVVKTDMHISRNVGQTYEGVTADDTHPATIRDAGVVIFSEDSEVKTGWFAKVTEGIVNFCIAPILRNGLGGGFFAVGKDCCDENGGFTCGDVADPSVKSSVVLAQETEKYASALQLLEAAHGKSYHGNKKGIKTPLPIFVRIIRNYLQEIAAPPPEYVYVYHSKITYCVAPVWKEEDSLEGKEVNFWAVGQDCCSQESFECGDVGVADARSGELVTDITGEWRLAVTMATVKWNVKTPAQPIFVKWVEKTLVPDPHA